MSYKVNYSNLFSPVKIGTVELKNRIIMAPMVTLMGTADGFMTEKERDYFMRRAIGGVALITVGDVLVVPNVQPAPVFDGIWDDKFISTWSAFARDIHDADAKLSIQLAHGGCQSQPAFTGNQPVAPSAIVSPLSGKLTRELTKGEIEELVEKFAEAALRARDAGVDMVEIQGAQGFLVHNFMTPLFNTRIDEYGGDVKGRVKFPIEIIKGVKERAGSGFPVIFRMVASDLVDGGLTIEDTKTMARMLAEAGADALHVTAGAGVHIVHLCLPPVDAGRAPIIDLITQIKSVVDVPVIAVQRIIDPEQAEGILKQGEADIISLGRALICDPDWPRKAAEGNPEDIRRCIGCLQGCRDKTRGTKAHITCLLNPAVGKEKEYEISRAEKSKKVMVVGGGPAGLEAAKIAALRGHKVTLYEKSNELGGQWNLACLAPKKQEFSEVIRYNIRQLAKLNVSIELNKVITPTLIEHANPDVVVIATGAVPIIPNIPGVNRSNVVTAHDVLRDRARVGDGVAVFGGGLVGCEVAEFLAERGKKITIVEMLEQIANDIGLARKPYLMQRLATAGVQILVSTKVIEICEDGMIAIDKNGQEKNIGIFDTVVLALGARPVNTLAKEIEGKVSAVYVIGDAHEVRMGIDAIADGARVARKI